MDPYNTASSQPAADRREMLSDDPHNEFDANRALAASIKNTAAGVITDGVLETITFIATGDTK